MALGWTGIMRYPLSCNNFATPKAARSGFCPKPTMAQVLSVSTAVISAAELSSILINHYGRGRENAIRQHATYHDRGHCAHRLKTLISLTVL